MDEVGGGQIDTLPTPDNTPISLLFSKRIDHISENKKLAGKVSNMRKINTVYRNIITD
jgi:hypothetical protein